MANEPTNLAEEQPEGQHEEQPEQDDKPVDDKLGDGGKRALQAERDARKQAERALADLQKQVEDANKTAEQKAAEALAEAQKASEMNAAKALRYEVAAAKGIDLKLASRLTGSTKEELEADADSLKALLAPTGPKPDPSQGHGSNPKPTNLSEAISAHYA